MREINKTESEKAVLVGLSAGSLDTEENSDEASLDELELLLAAAGGVCVSRVFQTREAPDARTFIGEGKAEEVRALIADTGANLAVFDNRLSPSQVRALEALFGVRVIDRSILILDIFAARAQTREGRMQVELAQLRELLPRLTGKGIKLSRLGGGIGTRGPGETKLETDRRHIGRRIAKLSEDLREVRRVRAVERRQREKTGIPVVALVGYTNAGKSTLLNRLTGSGVPANDRLFDTLDPATRRFKLGDTCDALLTDTVGFIRKLPHHLIEAFKATLEELSYADLILHVVDISDPEWTLKAQVAEKLAYELKAEDTPLIRVYNKHDLSRPGDPVPIQAGVFVSAATGEGLPGLLSMMEKTLEAAGREICLKLPYTQASMLDALYREGTVEEVRYGEDCIEVRARVKNRLLSRFGPYLSGAGDSGND